MAGSQTTGTSQNNYVKIGNLVSLFTPEEYASLFIKDGRLKVKQFNAEYNSGKDFHPNVLTFLRDKGLLQEREAVDTNIPAGGDLPTVSESSESVDTANVATSGKQNPATQEGVSNPMATQENPNPATMQDVPILGADEQSSESIPLVTPLVDDIPQTTTAVTGGGNLAQGASGSGTKRKFKWLIDEFTEVEDEYNKRDANGKLQAVWKPAAPVEVDGVALVEGEEIPDSIASEEFTKVWEELYRINGKPFYDAEANALGLMDRDLYFLLPREYDIPICPAEDVGKGLKIYKPGMLAIAAVYALAKAQFAKRDQTNAIRWAVLRVEALKAGWFDNQEHCKRVETPKDFIQTWTTDYKESGRLFQDAYNITSFIPFFYEFSFRTYGSGFIKNSSEEYVKRAERLAKSAQIDGISGYLPNEILYGQALRWVGVRRAREVLREHGESAYIPHIFIVRKTSAPAGQALITTSYAVIRSMNSAAWWQPIRDFGKYDDSRLQAVAKRIHENPWKYHILSSAYGEAALTADEKREIEEAREAAIQYAPIFQAYCEVVMEGSGLNSAKVLKKHSDANIAFFKRARRMFTQIQRGSVRTLDALFLKSVFGTDTTTSTDQATASAPAST